MSMAHPLPGLGMTKVDREQQLLRAASAPPDVWRLREMLRPMDPKECERIRMNAKKGWEYEVNHNGRCVTTYHALHARKDLDQPTKERVRPSSPNRMNKPHPPDVFLVTRLKKIRGCFEPDKAVPKPTEEDRLRNLQSYVNRNKQRIALAASNRERMLRPRTADAVARDSTRAKMQTVLGQVPGQAVEAWIKLSNDKDRKEILHAVDEGEKELFRQKQREAARKKKSILQLRRVSEQPQEIVFSSNRWLKKAGKEENDAVSRLVKAFRNQPPRPIPYEGPHFHITDYSTMFSSAPKPPHYDFQIHPEWHTPWHKQYEKRTMVTT